MPTFDLDPMVNSDLLGQPLENRANFWWNERGADAGDVSEMAFRRFFSRINRPGMVTAPHMGHNLGPSLSRFRQDNDSPLHIRPIWRDSPYGLMFFAAPAPDDDPLSEVNYNTVVLDVGGYRSQVLFQGFRHRDIDYSEPGAIDGIGIDFANRVRSNYDRADTEYLGHIPFTAISDIVNQEYLEEHHNPITTPPLAWVFNNFTVVPYDVVHFSESQHFVHWLLERAADIVLNTTATAAEPAPPPVVLTPEERAEAERLRIGNTVSSLTEWAASRDDQAIQVAIRDMDQVHELIHRKLQELTLLRLQAKERMITVETMRNMLTTPSELALISFRRMLESGLITSAMAVPRSTRLVFDTRELIAQDERTGAYHLVGKMRIDIDMSSGAVKFSNLDRRVDAMNTGMQAAHIYSDGRPCLGSFADTIPEFVARADWVGFIEAAIQFVESANTRDPAGKYVCRWPFIADPEAYGLPPYEGVVEPYVL